MSSHDDLQRLPTKELRSSEGLETQGPESSELYSGSKDWTLQVEVEQEQQPSVSMLGKRISVRSRCQSPESRLRRRRRDQKQGWVASAILLDGRFASWEGI